MRVASRAGQTPAKSGARRDTRHTGPYLPGVPPAHCGRLVTVLRSRLLLRFITTLLVVGVAMTMAPAAVARDARAEALRALLDDAAAFETALAASRDAADGEDPIEVFVEAYVDEARGTVDEDVIYHLLDGQSFGWVAPVGRDAAFVPTPPTAPPPMLGVSVPAPSTPGPVSLTAVSVYTVQADYVDQHGGSALRPRAP